MVSKKEILEAPCVKHATKELEMSFLNASLKDIITTLEHLDKQYQNARFEWDRSVFEYDIPGILLKYEVPMTEAEIATEKKRRELQCVEIDRRRNRKKLIEQVKAQPDVNEALQMLQKDPELARNLLEKL